jgi:hypothetical protein
MLGLILLVPTPAICWVRVVVIVVIIVFCGDFGNHGIAIRIHCLHLGNEVPVEAIGHLKSVHKVCDAMTLVLTESNVFVLMLLTK